MSTAINTNSVSSVAPGAAPVAPALRTVTFIATVDLKDSSGSWGGVHESDWAAVKQWYHGFTEGLVDGMENLQLELIETGRVRFTYQISEDDAEEDDDGVNNSMIADPDDDGNYPITLNGTEYIVMGFVEGQDW